MYIVGQEEIDAIAEVIRSGKLFRYGVGQECDRFEQRYASHLGVQHCSLTASGTYGLTAALIGLGIGPGDEVLVPAHTYNGDGDGGDRGRRHPGHRRCRRERHDRPGGRRRGHRTPHEGRDPGAHVGHGGGHGRHHGGRPQARHAGRRRRLPGRRRRL